MHGAPPARRRTRTRLLGPRTCPSTNSPSGIGPRLSIAADEAFADGQKAGGYADDYVRITVILAAVLFLIGIGSTFRLIGARYALVGVGLVLLVFALVLILQRPRHRTDRAFAFLPFWRQILRIPQI